MVAQLVPEGVYKKCVCSQCKKYLSVFPIKVYTNGKIKCGRCSEENDGGTISLFNKLMKSSLFKCINRYEGCRALLKMDDVAVHETICISGNYNCPICTRMFSGSAYEIVKHYNAEHPDCVLESKSFLFRHGKNSSRKKRLMFVEEEFVFIIFVELIEYTIYLSAVVLTDVANIYHKFVLRVERNDTSSIFETEVKPCDPLKKFQCDYFKIVFEESIPTEIGCNLILNLSQSPSYPFSIQTTKKKMEMKSIQTIPPEDVPKVALTDDFKDKYPTYKISPCGTALFTCNGLRIELICCNCKQFTGSSVHVCKNKHVICWDCKAFCEICSTTSLSWDTSMSALNDFLMLPCRWGCGDNFRGLELREHEMICKNFLKKCPICCQNYKYTILKLHMEENHLVNSTKAIYENLVLVAFLRSTPKQQAIIYFLQNHYLLRLKYKKMYDDTFSITVKVMDDLTDEYKFVIVNNKGECVPLISESEQIIFLNNFPRIHLLRLSRNK